MDGIDRRLVAALQVSPRASWGEIGRAVGEHERTVARRLQRLIADGVVRVTAIYDDLRTGHGRPVHLHVQVRPGAVGEVARALAERPDTRSVYALTGATDVGCELVAPSREELHHILSTQVCGIDGVLQTQTQVVLHTFTTVAEWHAPFLSDGEVAELRPAPPPEHLPEVAEGPAPPPEVAESRPAPPPECLPDEEGLSPLEQEIAELLAADGRIAFTAVAERLDLSVPTARRRVTSLIERRLLLPRAEVEPALLGLEVEAMLWLKVRPDGLDLVGRRLAAHPNVRYCAATSGNHSLIVQVVAAHEADLYRFLTGVAGRHDEITDVDLTLITRAYKRGHLHKSGLLTLAHQWEKTP
ncbi:Lrp/AsnC family transcriptional regulator [Nonomuraea sp. K274]|uniref:Lrp/AsnC family transcriptional regulator n=1 Tax=Nonomuraea cypriaca TaxID=1187855 RepID=A0A931A8I1_9ACTN|nr:Lrp/AsnC family transcriptional regulator [Nonomuraea cypriaca]MBF8185399.1 Lrp/AsnC family transcriptional regulator [Nonomuraea cypriaca]